MIEFIKKGLYYIMHVDIYIFIIISVLIITFLAISFIIGIINKYKKK